GAVPAPVVRERSQRQREEARGDGGADPPRLAQQDREQRVLGHRPAHAPSSRQPSSIAPAYRPGTSSETAAENVTNASAVDTRMMRAMRPLSAPKRSASIATLLALGSAATRATTISAYGSSAMPRSIALQPSASTMTGCT